MIMNYFIKYNIGYRKNKKHIMETNDVTIRYATC